MSDSKYLPIHVDIYDSMMRSLVEEALNKDITKTHTVRNVVRLDNERWLVRLEYDIRKNMSAVPTSEK